MCIFVGSLIGLYIVHMTIRIDKLQKEQERFEDSIMKIILNQLRMEDLKLTAYLQLKTRIKNLENSNYIISKVVDTFMKNSIKKHGNKM